MAYTSASDECTGCEAFFKYLKKEEADRRHYRSVEDLKLSLFQYIEGFYNSKRPHASLGYLTPNEMENNFSLRLAQTPST